MSYISIDILCPDCEIRWDDLVKRDEVTNKFPCPFCMGIEAERTISIPNVTRASYRDGVQRRGWDEVKHASKLNKSLGGTVSESEKKEIRKEIRKLGVKL